MSDMVGSVFLIIHKVIQNIALDEINIHWRVKIGEVFKTSEYLKF